MLDIQKYYGKLARQEAVTEDEIVELLKELAHFKGSTAYLASCQAATLESLPKSASKVSRGRHVSLCDAAWVQSLQTREPIKVKFLLMQRLTNFVAATLRGGLFTIGQWARG